MSQYFAILAPLPQVDFKNGIWISLKIVLSLHSRKGGIIHMGNASFVFN